MKLEIIQSRRVLFEKNIPSNKYKFYDFWINELSGCNVVVSLNGNTILYIKNEIVSFEDNTTIKNINISSSVWKRYIENFYNPKNGQESYSEDGRIIENYKATSSVLKNVLHREFIGAKQVAYSSEQYTISSYERKHMQEEEEYEQIINSLNYDLNKDKQKTFRVFIRFD